MKYIVLGILSFFLVNCKNVEVEKRSAEYIVNKSIEISGAAKVGNSKIDFDFRDKHYSATRNNGTFSLMRLTVEANNDSIFDVLTNDGFKRYMNDNEAVFVADSMKMNYSASVNSVHYFSVLPYGLNDKAVNKTLLKDVQIKGQNYHTIKVTFNQDGGGEDFEDVFLYWIHAKTFELDYLAYSYNESSGIGMRFREAYNERYIDGIRFVDYNNYKPIDVSIALTELPKLFETGELELLSIIELENIRVN